MLSDCNRVVLGKGTNFMQGKSTVALTSNPTYFRFFSVEFIAAPCETITVLCHSLRLCSSVQYYYLDLMSSHYLILTLLETALLSFFLIFISVPFTFAARSAL